MIFGRKIKELRDEQGVLQRQLAALLEIDTPMFSKIERGDRKAKREQVIKMAEYFHQDVNEMLTLWLADKVLDAIENEDAINLAAINVAKKEIKAKEHLEQMVEITKKIGYVDLIAKKDEPKCTEHQNYDFQKEREE